MLVAIPHHTIPRVVQQKKNGIQLYAKLSTVQAAIPLKSIPMSWQLPEILAECQTLKIRLLLTALSLRWHCADFIACFCDHDYVTESSLALVIQNPKAKYRVLYWHHCYDVGYQGRCWRWHFGQPNDSSIAFAPRNATFCKPLYNFSDKFCP